MCHLTPKSVFIKLQSHIWINSLALIIKYKGPDGTILAKLELIRKVESRRIENPLKDLWRMTWIIIVVGCIVYEDGGAEWPAANGAILWHSALPCCHTPLPHPPQLGRHSDKLVLVLIRRALLCRDSERQCIAVVGTIAHRHWPVFTLLG